MQSVPGERLRYRAVHSLRSASVPVVLAALAGCSSAGAPWPGGDERAIPIVDAEEDLSGASWNSESQTLWVVRQNRQVWQFGYDPESQSFEPLHTVVLPAGIGSDIEALTQVDHSAADELYTLSEKQGRLARVVGVDGAPKLRAAWNLETERNGRTLPPETRSSGAEGLEFVPDAALLEAGFRFPDGSAFSGSTKGMGGLIFVGHQIDGRLHVFDVNPDVSDDFANHGSFLTAVDEIAGLHFDRSNGLMFVWHNPKDENSLELSTLSSDDSTGTLDVFALYDDEMPEGNLEGIAVADRDSCGAFGTGEGTAFLTRDGDAPHLVAFERFPCSWTAPTVSARTLAIVLVAVAVLGSGLALARRRAPHPHAHLGGMP